MPRKKELPAPDSGEQDDLLSTEPQVSPDAPLTEPQEEPIPTESPPDEGAPEDDMMSFRTQYSVIRAIMFISNITLRV